MMSQFRCRTVLLLSLPSVLLGFAPSLTGRKPLGYFKCPIQQNGFIETSSVQLAPLRTQVSLEGKRGRRLLRRIRNVFRRDENILESDPEPEPVPIDPDEPGLEPEPREEDENEDDDLLEPEPEEQPPPDADAEQVSICVIGGGVSGLTAAFTAAETIHASNNANNPRPAQKIVLLERATTLGGRVQSDETADGYILDRGFAVFIDQYPTSKSLLDYDKLKLKKFLPGAFIKTSGITALQKVSDPLRNPSDLFPTLFSAVGTWSDKLRLVPLFSNVLTKSVQELFEEEETDTLHCLKERYGFSDKFIGEFLGPFLEGIYLAPLEQQSSRMFHFVFKMFSEGSACLPEKGIGAVSSQLAERATRAGVDIRAENGVVSITKNEDGFSIEIEGNDRRIQAQTLVLATDGEVSQRLISELSGFEHLKDHAKIPQRSVGCLYYAFDSQAPVSEPILVLNGSKRGVEGSPVNNICFPSVVSSSYAPEGKGLCSVSVLKPTMDLYNGKSAELDSAVREQLASWFPKHSENIKNEWELKRMYRIDNAQPGQLDGPCPASVHGGRDCRTFRGEVLPEGLLVCGDHVATSTLNGALESGVNAGKFAVGSLST